MSIDSDLVKQLAEAVTDDPDVLDENAYEELKKEHN